MTTNITADHRAAFDALVSGDYCNFALFSCFVNGEPGAAIVAVNKDGDQCAIRPLFVSVTPSLTLTDHDGQPASDPPPSSAAIYWRLLPITSPLRFGGAPVLMSEGGRAVIWVRPTICQNLMLDPLC